MKKILVTTAIEEIWGKDEEIIFLGDWCKKYNRKKIWSKRKILTLPDPWSDRNRRIAAFDYLEELYKEIIPRLSKNLNEVHKCNHSDRFWKILCGPWLQVFIEIVFHYWEALEDVQKGNKVDYTYGFNYNITNLVPSSMKEFESFTDTDSWNHYIISEIIKFQKKIPMINIDKDINDVGIVKHANIIELSTFRKIINKIFDYLAILNSSTSPFVMNSYMPKIRNIMFCIRERCFPIIISEDFINRPTVIKSQRSKIDLIELGRSRFENILLDLIPWNIPFNYVEGFSALSSHIDKMPWQKTPKYLLTGTEHWRNDVFKLYSSYKIESGSKLNIITHGGSGKYKYSNFESHEYDICDNYFTWGWSNHDKHFKGYFVKKRNQYKAPNKKSDLFHITLTCHRYSKTLDASPTYEQYLGGYIKDQISFLNNLTPIILDSTIIKLSFDLGNSLESRIEDCIPNLRYASIKDDYHKLLMRSRLAVSTYNCTTFLESLFYNIPTIIFWNPLHWELSDHSVPCFDRLKDAGVFHDSASSAAAMTNKIWNDVDQWWESQEVSSACNEFKNIFCRDSDRPILKMIEFCNQ